MKRLTPEQKRVNHLNRIILSAERGQQFMRPGPTGYTETQKAQFAKYQRIIDDSRGRIRAILDRAE